MDSGGGGEDDVALIELRAAEEFADPGTRGLHPAELRRGSRQIGRPLALKVPENVGVGEQLGPASRVLRAKIPRCADMVGDIARDAQQIGAMDDLEGSGVEGTDTLDMLRL